MSEVTELKSKLRSVLDENERIQGAIGIEEKGAVVVTAAEGVGGHELGQRPCGALDPAVGVAQDVDRRGREVGPADALRHD